MALHYSCEISPVLPCPSAPLTVLPSLFSFTSLLSSAIIEDEEGCLIHLARRACLLLGISSMSRKMHLGVCTPICLRNMVGRKHSRNTCIGELKPRLQGADIICLHVLSETVMVLNSVSAIKDLLEKRGKIYSGRPSFPISEMYAF
jgi:hypothetical protein